MSIRGFKKESDDCLYREPGYQLKEWQRPALQRLAAREAEAHGHCPSDGKGPGSCDDGNKSGGS